MSFSKESKTTMPMTWLSENAYEASFAGLNTPGGSTHPEAAVGNSKETVITRSNLNETRWVNRGLGFGLDPPVSNNFSTNTEFLNDEYFPPVAEENGPFMVEDTVMANSFPWDIGMEIGNSHPREEFIDTTSHTGQNKMFDNAILLKETSLPQAESPILQRLMGYDLGADDFQPVHQARPKYGEPSPTSDTWNQILKSNYETGNFSNHLSKSDSPLSREQREEAYFQLGFFCRVKPHLTRKQLDALAIVVELSYDEVHAFYQQKKSQPPSNVAHSRQSRHGQGPRVSRSAKRFRGSDTSSSPEPFHWAYGPSRSDSSSSMQNSERSAIAPTPGINRQVREPLRKTYECTWRGCSMSFASKSDWKRHEEVHCPQWEWSCTFESQSTEKFSKAIPCNRPPFKRSDHLREHLRKDHKCVDASKVETGRQSINPQSPFNKTCGFCGQITRSWLDRIDHIAEHFKNGKNMSEWIDPRPEDVFEEESDPSDNSDNDENDDASGNGDLNGNDNNNINPTSQNEDTRNGPGNDNRRDFSTNPQSGNYHSGNGYRRPGTMVIRYHAPSHGKDIPDSRQLRDNESLGRELDSRSSFWSKMRTLLKERNSKKDISSAPSPQATKTVSSEAGPNIAHEYKERIEFYCILCTKQVSMDPSLPNTDEYHCVCSETAIKEHIMSVALAGLHIDTPSTKNSEGVARSELQSHSREKTANNIAMATRERHLTSTKPQRRPALGQVEEQLSYSIQRYMKTLPASEQLIELNQDENSWVEVHSLDPAGSKSDERAETLFSSVQRDTLAMSKSGKLGQVRGSDRIPHRMKSSPELRRRRT